MVLKRIITRNIQNHREVVVELPPTGLIVFTGDNSNGKSVIGKVTQAIITGKISKPRKRASLVNRNAAFGEAIYVRDDDVTLTLHLAREAAATYIKYEEPGFEPVVRYLADKSYKELINRFGWHYDDNSGITLNLAFADEALLFYKTSNKINSSIVTTATSDSTAEKVEEKFATTLSEMRSLRENYITHVKTFQTALTELHVEDIETLSDKKETLSRLYRNISSVYFPKLPEIEPVPDVKFVDIVYPNLPDVKYPKFYNFSVTLPDITSICDELKTLREHRCPTCGRSFVDES